ncbi:MAG: 3-dehydroquinate synthase family protein [Bacteroidota bacterium]
MKGEKEKILFSNQLKKSTLIDECKSFKKIFVLMDTHTKKHCWHLLENYFPKEYTLTYTIKAGEKHKNLQSVNGILSWLLKNNAEKKHLLLNLGGGVVSDIGAFAASIFKRGIKYANIPTSLLAMVDASIGGKNGIDFNHAKNVVGTFSKPEFIFICPLFLNSLNKRNFNNGLAEMLKHKILDGKASDFSIKKLSNKNTLFAEIKSAVHFKSATVNKDFEDKGIRNILNFGHTIGHAIESYMLQKNKNILHGEAIAAGMICELYISSILFNYPQIELAKTEKIIFSIFHKINLPGYSSLKKFLLNDKKKKDGKIKFSLLKSINEPVFDVLVDEKLINKSIAYYQRLN